MEDGVAAIPFGKAVRVGNFRIWRSNFTLDFMPTCEMLSEEDRARLDRGEIRLKRQKENVECINISNMDGTWMTRIPQTYEMYGMLTMAWQWYNSDNAEEKKRGEDYFSTVLSNMSYVSSIGNGFYHQALMMVATAYAYPALLSDRKKSREFGREADSLVRDFLSWRKEYDRHMNRPLSGEEMSRDEAAQQIMEEMEKRQDDSGGVPSEGDAAEKG